MSLLPIAALYAAAAEDVLLYGAIDIPTVVNPIRSSKLLAPKSKSQRLFPLPETLTTFLAIPGP